MLERPKLTRQQRHDINLLIKQVRRTPPKKPRQVLMVLPQICLDHGAHRMYPHNCIGVTVPHQDQPQERLCAVKFAKRDVQGMKHERGVMLVPAEHLREPEKI